MGILTTTTALKIVVRGSPAPQGSKRAFAVRGKGGVPTGRVAVIESSHDRVKSWRQAVVEAALEATQDGQVPPLRGPLCAAVTFTLKRPQSHFRTGRNAALLRDSAPPYPMGQPDISKLLRATEDALTSAGVWEDDAHISHYFRLVKLYPPVPWAGGGTWQLPVSQCGPRAVAGLDDADVMGQPGAVIRIARMSR